MPGKTTRGPPPLATESQPQKVSKAASPRPTARPTKSHAVPRATIASQNDTVPVARNTGSTPKTTVATVVEAATTDQATDADSEAGGGGSNADLSIQPLRQPPRATLCRTLPIPRATVCQSTGDDSNQM